MHRPTALLSTGLFRSLSVTAMLTLMPPVNPIVFAYHCSETVIAPHLSKGIVRLGSLLYADNTGFLGKGRYQIQSVASSHLLALREDRATLQQWPNNGTLDQQWDVEDAGGGYFYLRSAQTKKVLEALAARDGAEVLARGERVAGRDQQRWRIVDLGKGQSLIVAHSGKVLDVADNSRREGARLQLWGEHRGDNQRFKFDRLATSNIANAGGKSETPARALGGIPMSLATGHVRWRGRVDQEVWLEVRGQTVTERLVRGTSFNNARYTFSSPLPHHEVKLRLDKHKARGAIEIVARPSAANKYTVVIRLSDPQRDAADYEFELTW